VPSELCGGSAVSGLRPVCFISIQEESFLFPSRHLIVKCPTLQVHFQEWEAQSTRRARESTGVLVWQTLSRMGAKVLCPLIF
jgi:hypothetical protein